MAQDYQEATERIIAQYSPLPTTKIVTPCQDTLTGRRRDEEMTLYVAPGSREMVVGDFPLKDSSK